jgi:nicotinate-nucleotide adenylyltransferase
MVQLACHEQAQFEASRLEEGADPSYSIDTIERVRAAHSSSRLYFLIGADAFSEIASWRRSHDVISAVTFIVVSRPGAEYRIPPQARVERLENFDLTISSSGIRESIKAGSSILPVPASVAAYIQQRGLYR